MADTAHAETPSTLCTCRLAGLRQVLGGRQGLGGRLDIRFGNGLVGPSKILLFRFAGCKSSPSNSTFCHFFYHLQENQNLIDNIEENIYDGDDDDIDM